MTDYRQTADGDLDLTSGDLQLTESTSQHQRDLLLGEQGHIRHRPEMGIGAQEYLLAGDWEELLRRSRQVLTQDGERVERLDYDAATGEMEIIARYEED